MTDNQQEQDERMTHELALLQVVYRKGLRYEALELAACLGLANQFKQDQQEVARA